MIIKRGRLADVGRVLGMWALGLLLLRGSTPLAVLLGMPELAVIGLGAGWGCITAGTSHVLRRLFFPGLDLRQIMRIAVGDKQAGLVVLGICLVLAALILSTGQARAGDLPPGARAHLPVLLVEQREHWPGGDAATLAGQIEQESCISLKHSRCWSPRAELKTDREQGVGLGQITRTPRFDTLAELRAQFPQLAGWSWDAPTLYDPAYQLRALVLMDRRNYERITGTATELDRLAMMLVAYNGGQGRVVNDRRLCAATPGCDPARWWGHVEHTSLLPRKSTHAGYRSFYTINREYPRQILLVRRGRYVEHV